MKSTLGVGAVLVSVSLLAGCGGSDGEPAAGSTPASSPAASSSATPTGDPTESPAPSATPAGDTDPQCLVDGSPWHVSIPDLESQFPQVMHGINVTGVNITGGQTLTVEPDLHAAFADSTTTTIDVALRGGLEMKVVQKHRGRAAGQLHAEGATLTASGWTGGIVGSTKVSINGRAAQAPFAMPTGDQFGDHPMTFSCDGSTLYLSVEGSPFQYLYKSS